MGGGGGAVDVYQATDIKETMDEKAVEESLQVWYGLTNGEGLVLSPPGIWSVFVAAVVMFLAVADS